MENQGMATTWTVMNIDAAPQEEVCFSCFRYIVRILTRDEMLYDIWNVGTFRKCWLAGTIRMTTMVNFSFYYYTLSPQACTLLLHLSNRKITHACD